MDKKAELNGLLEIDSFENLSEKETLNVFLKLIEYSHDIGTDIGTKKVIELSEKINPESIIPEKRCLYHYYLSIAWGDIRHRNHTQPESWEWDHFQVEQEIIHLRSSI